MKKTCMLVLLIIAARASAYEFEFNDCPAGSITYDSHDTVISSSRYFYDAANRLAKEIDSLAGPAANDTFARSYEQQGDTLTEVNHYSSNPSDYDYQKLVADNDVMTQAFLFDSSNTLQASSVYSYDANHDMVKESITNFGDIYYGDSLVYKYNTSHKVLSETQYGHGVVASYFEYQYDSLARIAKIISYVCDSTGRTDNIGSYSVLSYNSSVAIAANMLDPDSKEIAFGRITSHQLEISAGPSNSFSNIDLFSLSGKRCQKSIQQLKAGHWIMNIASLPYGNYYILRLESKSGCYSKLLNIVHP
jgi:hypothetical protein